MNVHAEVEKIWKDNSESIEKRIGRWVDDLLSKKRKDAIIKARKQFHQWDPLKIYTSVSQASKKGLPEFSVRYCGQEIAKLKQRNDNNHYLVFSDDHMRTNVCFQFPPEYMVLNGDKKGIHWSSPEATEIRKFFTEHPQWKAPSNSASEHFIESIIIGQMKSRTSSKFGGALKGIQPVLLHGVLPFQVPVPFSACSGKPILSPRGSIDILARRRGSDGQVRLSVWELKKPGKIDHSVFQSYIYSVVLLKMLRSSSKNAWYELFGFSRELPKSLEIESVVLLSEKMRGQYEKQLEKLLDSNPLTIVNGTDNSMDKIKLACAFYDDETLKLKSFQEYSQR
ncbi:MAG: hypothetical protein IPQ16_14795 [Geobacteraceae bacterium]|nr:hypothetical protein [Geobacteraceae bacterium]